MSFVAFAGVLQVLVKVAGASLAGVKVIPLIGFVLGGIGAESVYALIAQKSGEAMTELLSQGAVQ